MSLQTPPTQSRTLWDYIKNGISPAFTNPVSQAVGSVISTAFQNPMGDAAKAVGRKVAGKLLTPFEKIAELEGQTFKGEALRKGISEKILPDTLGGYTATKAERKRASEKISMGRALQIRIDSELDAIFGRNILSKVQPESYDPMTGKIYNVYDDAKREERFDQLGFTGNLVTGSFDLVAGTLASPLVGFGQFLKVGKKFALERPVQTERVVNKKELEILNKAEAERTDYFTVQNRLDELEVEDVTITGRTADEVLAEKTALENALPDLKSKAEKAADRLSKIGYAGGTEEFLRQSTILDAEQLLKHRVVKESSHPELLAGLLGENKDLYQAGLIYRAAGGDINAQRLLAAESTSTFMALQRARKPLADLEMDIKAYKQADGDPHKLSLMEENFSILKDEVDDLVRRDSFLQRAVQAADQKVLEGRVGASVFANVEKFRAGKASTFGEASTLRNWDVEYFQRNPFVATVAVVTWPFRERPAGWVRVKGIDTSDSAREIEAFMQNVSGWKGIEGANIRASYLRRYTQATNQIEKEQAVYAMQNAAITAVAKKNGLTKAQADEIIEKWEDARSTAVEHYRRKNYLIDENNTIVKVPQLSTQLADSIPMIDILKLDKKLKATKSAWATAATRTKDMVVKPLDLLDEIWRPAVLFRLGYPIRNVGEGWGRFAAYMGPVTSLSRGLDMIKVKPVVVNGKVVDVDGVTARWLKNRHSGLRDFVKRRNFVGEAKANQNIARGLPADYGFPKVKASWNEVIELQEDSIVLNRGTLNELEDRLKELKAQGAKDFQIQGIIDEIDIRKEFEKQATVRLKEFAKEATKKGIKGNRYSVGQGYFSYGGYRNIPMIYEDNAGDVLKQLVSSESTKAIELRSPTRIYGGYDSAKYIVDDFIELHPGNENYFAGLARAVNRQFRNSEVMVRLLRGDSIEKVADWLRTPEGIRHLQLTKYTDPEEYALKMQYAVERYIPDPALRVRLSKEEVSAAELQVILGRRKDLQSIHGDSFREVPDLTGYGKYTQTVRKAFRFIGSLPEDSLVRHPFADEIYQRALRESVDNANRQGKLLTQQEFDGIVTGARRKALVETRRYLYTIERHSNVANLTRFFEPFFMSAQNTAQSWSRLVYRDPRLVGAAGYIYNAPERAGLMQTDVNGNEIVVMQIPNWMRKGKFLKKALDGQEAISFQKGGANLILQGQDWWRVGDGPIAQIVASELIKKYPDSKITPILRYFVPFGMSRQTGSWDMLLPTIPKRVISLYRKTDDRTYNEFFITATRVEEQKYQLGLRDEPTLQEVEERVNAFAILWAGVAATSGVAFKFRPEFQFYIDKARKYREKYGPDAAIRFYQDHPDYFPMFFSISRNPSNLDPTTAAVTYKNKYQNLIDKIPQKYPEFTQLIANSYGDSPADFDNNAYTWQIINSLRTGDIEKIRQPQSAAQVARTNKIAQGWVEYGIFADKRDAALQALMKADPTITSIYSKNAAGLREDKKLFIEKMREKNPDWWDEFGSFNTRRSYRFLKFAQTAMKDKKFMADRGQAPVWEAMDEYMKRRKQLVNILKARELQGGSANIDAKSNEDLAADWGDAVELLKQIDPSGTFSYFYNRFLDTDTFEEIK